MRTRERRFLLLLSLYALTYVLLHMLVERLPRTWAYFWYPSALIGPGGRLSPAEWLWGVYAITSSPQWLRWLVGLLAMVLVIWAGIISTRRQSDDPRFLDRLNSLPFPMQPHWQAIIALASLVLFYAGRVVHTRWGDAYLLVNGIAHPDVRLTYNWQAPLDTFVHAQLFRLGERWLGWTDAMPSYWLVSSLAGAAAVWVLLRLATEIGMASMQRWVIFGTLATLGSMQLFFGYPENYTIISLLILIYVWLAWRYSQGMTSLWMPSIVLALANGFHPSTLVLQPSLWVLALQVGRRRRLVANLPALLIPPIVIALSVVILMTAGGHGLSSFAGAEAPGGGDHSWLVPLTTIRTEWEYYTMFSRGHLIEFINQQLLVAPFTLPLLVLLPAFFRRLLPRDAYSRFLLVAAACYLLLIWLWNPDYGGQRDWDLFSVASWPTSLLAVYWLIRVLNPGSLARAALIIIPIQALHTAAWVYSNTRPWEWPTGG
ncbi:MAG: hypothetical protein J5I90_06940 [Caldilineales bacterium]|nr:hypothetical protein [Caldilineales bacterium]